MTPPGAGLLGFIIGSVVTWVVAQIDHAPMGYEDETGYHAGLRPTVAKDDAEILDMYDDDVVDLAMWAERERPRRGA